MVKTYGCNTVSVSKSVPILFLKPIKHIFIRKFSNYGQKYKIQTIIYHLHFISFTQSYCLLKKS